MSNKETTLPWLAGWQGAWAEALEWPGSGARDLEPGTALKGMLRNGSHRLRKQEFGADRAISDSPEALCSSASELRGCW